MVWHASSIEILQRTAKSLSAGQMTSTAGMWKATRRAARAGLDGWPSWFGWMILFFRFRFLFLFLFLFPFLKRGGASSLSSDCQSSESGCGVDETRCERYVVVKTKEGRERKLFFFFG